MNDIDAGKVLWKRLATGFLAFVRRNDDFFFVEFLFKNFFCFIKQVVLKTFIYNIFFRPSAEQLTLKVADLFF